MIAQRVGLPQLSGHSRPRPIPKHQFPGLAVPAGAASTARAATGPRKPRISNAPASPGAFPSLVGPLWLLAISSVAPTRLRLHYPRSEQRTPPWSEDGSGADLLLTPPSTTRVPPALHTFPPPSPSPPPHPTSPTPSRRRFIWDRFLASMTGAWSRGMLCTIGPGNKTRMPCVVRLWSTCAAAARLLSAADLLPRVVDPCGVRVAPTRGSVLELADKGVLFEASNARAMFRDCCFVSSQCQGRTN